MDPVTLASLVLVVGILGCLALGIPVAISIGLPSLAAAVVFIGWDSAVFLTAQRMFTGINSFPLLAIPLFVLAGVLMNSGGIANRLIDAAKVLVGKMPSSMAATNVVANGLFGAVSGAAVAAAAAVGTVTQHGCGEKATTAPTRRRSTWPLRPPECSFPRQTPSSCTPS